MSFPGPDDLTPYNAGVPPGWDWGDSFGKSQGWPEMKTINGVQHHYLLFCTIIVSVVSKCFYILIKNVS